jgi:hypothetical protein
MSATDIISAENDHNLKDTAPFFWVWGVGNGFIEVNEELVEFKWL